MKKLGRFLYLHGRTIYYILAVVVGVVCGLLIANDRLSIGGAALAVILTALAPFFVMNLIAIRRKVAQKPKLLKNLLRRRIKMQLQKLRRKFL